jgi:hypothetical protein
MPVFPASEARSWGPIFAEEFANAPTPYFGINIFDVPAKNWEAVLKNVRQQLEMVKTVGGESYLWTVRDHGAQKRVLWINRYPHAAEELKNMIGQFVEGPLWKEFFNLIDSYDWFIATEQPSTEP